MKHRTLLYYLLMVSTLDATIINVPADRATIQAGIDAADNGDTVLVRTGTYVENINFGGKNVVVGSWFLTTGYTSFIYQTVIDGNQSESGVRFESGEGATALLSGFTITNGQAVYGGGIHCQESNPRLENLRVHENKATFGGGIYCWKSNSRLVKVTVFENYATRDGGGIYCDLYSSLSLVNVEVSGNNAYGDGGGILCANNSSPTLTNVLVSGNSSMSDGGGIHCIEFSSPRLTNVTVSKNSAFNAGGGIVGINNSTPILENTIVWNNTMQEIRYNTAYFDRPVITYSNVRYGLAGIESISDVLVNWWDGNIDKNPLFVNARKGDFHLRKGSPCINTGTPSPSFRNPDGSRNDMGAYGGPNGNW